MKKNKTNKSENTIIAALVFDRFYGAGANAAAVILGRVFIAAAITFFSLSYIFSMYELPVNKTLLPFVGTLAAVVFSLLFSAVKRGMAISVLVLVSGVVIASTFDTFWQRFSYFVDGIILEFNGRLFDTTASTLHTLSLIEIHGRYTIRYVDGAVFGSVILCVLFALITAAGVIGKPHILPSLSVFLLLLTPKLASERLFFGWQLIPLIALYAGMLAIGSYYRDGLAIRHVYAAGGYRRKVSMDDRRFNAAVKAQNAGQRVVSRGLHYSKYFSSVMSTVAIFTVLGIILGNVFKNSTGIDYDPFYEMLQNLGNGFGGSSSGSPFKVGTEADYFTSPSNSAFKSNNRLRLTSPSTSTKEVIRVTKDLSQKPVYLRGDIGIDFDGSSWSSPVTEEPQEWLSSGLYSYMLPVEITLSDQLYGYLYSSPVDYPDVEVEYLCDTDVIFAPAYDHEYNLFDPMYGMGDSDIAGVSIYGDFSARRKSDKAVGETLSYTAVVPNYTDASDENDIEYFGVLIRLCGDNFIEYGTNKLNVDLTNANVRLGRGYFQCDYRDYKKYVYNQYLGVPDSMKADIDEFIERSGLDAERERLKQEYFGTFYGYVIHTTETYGDGRTEDRVEYEPLNRETDALADRFLSAVAVSEYLKSNYTYSLDARVDRRNPVMSFLNDTQSGHCALYASAMTLILREWGIPARYCTGFAAASDLTMTTLRSKDLHAWCEIYLDELGWVTFDPTAAAIFNNAGGGSDTSSASSSTISSGQSSVSTSSRESSSTPQSSSTSSTASSSAPSSSQHSGTSNTHDSSVSSESEQTITFAQVLPYILTILAILAAIALIVLAVKAYVELQKRANKQVQAFHREQNSEFVYEKLLAVLRFCKLRPVNGEQPHAFFERAEQTLDCTICDNYALLERLAFKETVLDESERALLGRTFDKVYRAAESRAMLIGRIRLRLLVLSKKV